MYQAIILNGDGTLLMHRFPLSTSPFAVIPFFVDQRKPLCIGARDQKTSSGGFGNESSVEVLLPGEG